MININMVQSSGLMFRRLLLRSYQIKPVGVKSTKSGGRQWMTNQSSSFSATIRTERKSFGLNADVHFSKGIIPLLPRSTVGTIRYLHQIPGATMRDMAELEERVWTSVTTNVKDPELGQDLKTLGWIKKGVAVSEDGTVQVLIRIPSLLHPSLEELKDDVRNAARDEVSRWLAEKDINMEAKVNVQAVATKPTPWMVHDEESQKDIEARLGPGLANVSHVLAVYSCKGGVGKSTIAVNLAYELARMGGRVGLLDVDVYGPSLPVLVRPDDLAVRRSPLGKGMVYPIDHQGVKLLSLGFVSANSGVPGSGMDSGASVLRGPMAGKVVTQLLKGTDWGGLDVLILDLPPGTGDVQLTICQEVELSGAVGVTTPSKLAIADARKGIEMFSSLGVPTIAMVENMSYFECEGGGKHYPFGKGFYDFLKEDVAVKDIELDKVCQLPISTATNDANDKGIPLTSSMTGPDEKKIASKELDAFNQLSKIVSRGLLRLQYSGQESETSTAFISFEGQEEEEQQQQQFDMSTIQVTIDKGKILLRAYTENGAFQIRIDPDKLRSTDPRTGQALPDEDATNPNTGKSTVGSKPAGMVTTYSSTKDGGTKPKIVAERIEKKAKVGFEITWSDKSKIIYSRKAIVIAAGGQAK